MKKALLFLILIGVIVAGGFIYLKLPKTNSQTGSNSEKSYTVLAFSDKDEMMVISENSYDYIVDYKGNKKTKIDGACQADTYIMNNYVYTNNKIYGDSEFNYVFDSKGKEVYKANGSIIGISESGYCLISEKMDSMASGENEEYNIVDLKDGKSVYSSKSEMVYSDYKDYFIKEELNAMVSGTLIDSKTLEEYKDYASNKDYLKEESEELKSFNMPYYNGEKNYLGSTIIDVNKKTILKNGKIIDFDGNELKDISEGDVKYICSYDDNIFVVTRTGYVYTLDKKYEYIAKPVKITDTKLPKNILVDANAIEEKINQQLGSSESKFYVTSNGLFYANPTKGTDNNIKIEITVYDDTNFDMIRKFDVEVKDIKKDFICTENGLVINSSDNNVHVIQKDNEKVLNNSRVTKYSNEMINYFSDGNGSIIDLESLKELTIEYRR